MFIKVKELRKSKNRIEVSYEHQGLDKYLNTNVIPFWEYSQDISEVPDSVAIIPFICDLLPMAFVLDAEIIVDELDKSFYDCISEYRKGYKLLAPMLDFKGSVTANKVVLNDYEIEKNGVLFSGGVDAASSLTENDSSISDCITIWGADIKSQNEAGWKAMSASIEDIVKKFNKNWIVIKSSFREFINEREMTKVIAESKDDWWHCCQHGIALLGCTAPLAYANRYGKIFIASSFTKEFRPICASDPYTDNCYRVGNSQAVHDGFEFDRCQKIQNIARKLDESGETVKLHVCWEADSGNNCGRCEKCERSYLNCRAVGVDASRLGIVVNVPMKDIKHRYCRETDYSRKPEYSRMMVIKKHMDITYGNNPPEDLMWLHNLNPDKMRGSVYWTIKKTYRKAKRLLKRLGVRNEK